MLAFSPPEQAHHSYARLSLTPMDRPTLGSAAKPCHATKVTLGSSSGAREDQGAATVEEHVGRYRELAEAGGQTAIMGLSDAEGPSR
jgi:hypothetical protein